MNTLMELQEIIAANLGIPAASVHSGSRTSDLPGWDSLRHLSIVMDIEQKFGFKFAMEEIGGLDSVDKILKAVETRVVS